MKPHPHHPGESCAVHIGRSCELYAKELQRDAAVKARTSATALFQALENKLGCSGLDSDMRLADMIRDVLDEAYGLDY